MDGVKIMSFFAAVLLAQCACGKPAKEAKEIVCKTCNDTGSVSQQCPVCRGTKYVWQCMVSKNKGIVYEDRSFRFDANGNPVREQSDGEWCGYGSIYKPIHSNCKNTRKRLTCPNCVNGKSKTSASGKVTVACPDCDGHGKRMKSYWLIRNVLEVEYNRDYLLRQAESGCNCSSVERRKMTDEELADYRIENLNCKVFESDREMIAFLKNGEGQKAGAKWYFVVRDAKNVARDDRSRVLDDLAAGHFTNYGGANILRRKFTDDEVKEFQSMNQNCKMFRDMDEFTGFLRAVKVVPGGKSSVPRFDGARSHDGVQRSNDGGERDFRIADTNGTRRFVGVNAPSHGCEPQQQRSAEELQKMIDAENAHDREMFERKFGKEGSSRISNAKNSDRQSVPNRGTRMQDADVMMPNDEVARLNDALGVKSFCGIEFGVVSEAFGEGHCERGQLNKPFRIFTSYERWGTKFNRVGRIDLSGKVTDLSEDEAQSEIRAVALILEKKYGVHLMDDRSVDGKMFSMSGEDQDKLLKVQCTMRDNDANFTLSFKNKQVDAQNAKWLGNRPKRRLQMSADEGADLL